MIAKRIIPCLDIANGQVVKGITFRRLAKIGNPVEFALKYYNEGADELCLLDINASAENRNTMIGLVKKVAKTIFIPFTVGGGVKSIADIQLLLKNGADKVSVGTTAVKNPSIIRNAANRFGSQCIVVSLDVKIRQGKWVLFIYGGKKETKINAVNFAKKCEKLGAGELLVNSIDRDGTVCGYETELLKEISESVKIPIIASSGAGSPEDIYNALETGKADAAIAASIFHYKNYTIKDVKEYLKKKGVEVRL